jgi:GAF domain-containing protein
MGTALSIVNDSDRLDSVRRSGLVGQSSAAFDRLTRLAHALLGVPATFLSIVDEDRDFYLSQVGFGEPLSTTRSLSGKTFCHLAIANDGPLVINDTHADPEHRAIPTVDSLGVAAYLGVPIRLPDEQVLGSFCAIDDKAHVWTEVEIDVMVELARSAEREMALQETARREEQRAAAAEETVTRLEQTLAELEQSHWHIRKLQDLMPLCMICQKVHRPDETWEPLVNMLARDGLLVSHGYCPDCAPHPAR